MSSTTISSSNLQLIIGALDDYLKQTGEDLQKNPLADKLRSGDSPDCILELLQERATAFKDYREGNRNLITWLSPVVQVVHTFSSILGEVASFVPFPPTKAIFVGVDVLLAAAIGVSTSYDALVDLFECVGNFLKRLHIYTEKITLTSAMTDIIVKILVEVLSVLALATKQIKQGRFKKFAKKILGESEIEAVLQRLDRLTQEEARMTASQTLEVVYGLVNNMKVVMGDGKASTNGILQALVMMQETANQINKTKREQLQKDIRSWLSPPDPSKNQVIARRDYHRGTAAWFTQGGVFEEWKEAGSLIWIHGKPGSGKSVLCSTIIQEAKASFDAGLALMAYFYFDFRDTAKQDIRGLLTSLVGQLCAKSDPCYDILSDLYSRHDAGSQQPDDDALTQCLKDMLELPGQPPIYIVVDALDECPNTSGVVSPRERVIGLVEELIELRLPNLRLCITSRPEADIRAALGPLASHLVSLHDQRGQRKDIADYVSSVVHSDRSMRRWRTEDKQLVIDTLSRNADGMFRWVVCQLETLRRSFPAAIRRALDDLPRSLDATYERTLLGISREKQEYAQRLFQCLAMSVRPLRVEELAEIIAIRFEAGALPDYNVDWRLEDSEEAVLTACSSLIAIVNIDGSPVVQFTHFSVKEFLTSDRLANAGENLSRYYIVPRTAHTTLAKASLSILLQLDDRVDKKSMENFPLAMYAARHWVDHGRIENVSSNIQDAMERLFDPDKPHFATWLWIYNIDRHFLDSMSTTYPTQPETVPLYTAALCGFRSLVEHLVFAYPQDINAKGGYHTTPLHAAVAKGYIDIALLLLEHGADVNIQEKGNGSPLHKASQSGRRNMVELLLEHGADVDLPNGQGDTPMILASTNGELEVVRVLLRHGAAVDSRNAIGFTPLMSASRFGHVDVVQLLFQTGVDVDSPDNKGWTPLQSASRYGHLDVVRVLLQSGAAVNSRNHDGWTPLQWASRLGHLDLVRVLLQGGAAVNAPNNDGWSPLQYASAYKHLDIVRELLDHGADAKSQEDNLWTALHQASDGGDLEMAQLLVEHGADVNVANDKKDTPLSLASSVGEVELARFLLERGADVTSSDHQGWTSLHFASRNGHLDTVQLLLDRGADVNALTTDLWTSLHLVSTEGYLNVAELLIQHDADVDQRNNDGETLLGLASGGGQLEIARLLVKCGSNANSQDNYGRTPLCGAARNGHLDVVKLLLESGADVNIRDNDNKTALRLANGSRKHEIARVLAEHMRKGSVDSWNEMDITTLDTTPQNTYSNGVELTSNHDGERAILPDSEGTSLHIASEAGNANIVRSLLHRGADVDERDEFNRTPLYVASREGRLEVVKLLIQHGADINSRGVFGWNPLHAASRFEHLDIVVLLLDHGADVNAQKQDHWTPLHLASSNGYVDIVKLLLERGADVHLRNEEGRTPSQEAVCGGQRELARILSGYGVHGK